VSYLGDLYVKHAKQLVDGGHADAIPRVRVSDYAEALGGIQAVMRAVSAGRVWIVSPYVYESEPKSAQEWIDEQ